MQWLLACAIVVGKYRGKAPAMVSAVEHAAKDALAEFGYEPPRESGAPG